MSVPRGLPVIYTLCARRQLGHILPPRQVHGLCFDLDCWMYFYFQISYQYLKIITIHIQTHIPSFSKKQNKTKQKQKIWQRQGPYSYMATISSSWVVTAPFLMRLRYRISHSPHDGPTALPLLSITHSVPAPSNRIYNSSLSSRQRMLTGMHNGFWPPPCTGSD